jgi:hypothetical protein
VSDASGRHRTAVELAIAESALARKKAAYLAAKARRDELRQARDAALIEAIRADSDETNVSLASRFGLRSETSVRNIRKSNYFSS